MNLRELFGADDDISGEKLTLYIPDKDRQDREYPDHGVWVDTAATLLAYVNRGSTRMAPAGGKWFEQGCLVSENTALIYSYIDLERFDRDAEGIAQFVHTFGRRTGQSTVYVEMSGEVQIEGTSEVQYRSRTYRITRYDKAVADDVPLEELLDHIIPEPLP